MSKKQLMIGNEAIARGLYEAGCRVVSSYPGTPSTEITEFVSTYEEIYSEWAPNEKVGLEVAIGASIGGARSCSAMKHVGLNVAADPLFTASYTGVNGGLLIIVADDSGMHSSQNEQDSRHYAVASKVPMLEPSNSQECLDFAKLGFELSEQFDTPVILRLSTRVSHSQSIVQLGDRKEVAVQDYVKNPAKYVMMPANARGRHVFVEQRMIELTQYAAQAPINTVEWNDTNIGVVTSGVTYNYAKEALGDKASYLKLGMVHPISVDWIRQFADKVKKLYILEELDPVIEDQLKAQGVECQGKELFSKLFEYSQTQIKEKLLGEKTETMGLSEELPVRPPVMCPGCPHRGLFYTLSKLKVMVSGDIGCYTLGALPPLSAMDTTICMGASVSGLHGFNKARGEAAENTSVAVIGDSTFIHSGVTGLINIVYNQSNSVVIILDNSITGMTGHQQNPTTGYNIKGDPASKISLEALCEAIGVRRVSVVDPNELELLEKTIKEELAAEEPSVIITRRPCALLKTVKAKPALFISHNQCTGCRACMRIGCPAIRFADKKASIDATLCVGCDLCVGLCRFGAIGPADTQEGAKK